MTFFSPKLNNLTCSVTFHSPTLSPLLTLWLQIEEKLTLIIALIYKNTYHYNTIIVSSFTNNVDTDPTWLLQDATFEKMGQMMSENGGRLLGMFDELSAFLTKIKLYSSRGLTDSHELAMFLELYNGNPWTRTTGKLRIIQ